MRRQMVSTVYNEHRHAKLARVFFFFVIGAFVEPFTVMICLSFLVAMYSKKETGNL